MNRIPVSSSTITAVGYDDQTRTLELEFTNGSAYRYFDVGQDVYETIVSGSVSVGRYFNEHVKDVFRYAKL